VRSLRWAFVLVVCVCALVGAPAARAQELSMRERVYGNLLAERLGSSAGGDVPHLARVSRAGGAGVRVSLPGLAAERLRFPDRAAAEAFASDTARALPAHQPALVEVRGDQVLVVRGPRLADPRVESQARRSGWDVLPAPSGSPWVMRSVAGPAERRPYEPSLYEPRPRRSPVVPRHGASELIDHHLRGDPLRELERLAQPRREPEPAREPARASRAQRDAVSRALATTAPQAMGAHQRSRALRAYDALSEDARRRFDHLLSQHAYEPAVRDQLLKALAASSPIEDIEWLAQKLAGQDPAWIAKNTRLTSGSGQEGPALRQQFSDSCVPATAQVLRGEYDPVYALRTRLGNRDVTAARDDAPHALNPALARDQKDQLERANGRAAARNQGAFGRGITPERAAALLSEQAGVTGLTYKPDAPWPTPVDPERAISLLKTHLRAGRMVPLAITNAEHQAGHVVMATAMREDAGGTSFLVFEPYHGRSVWVSAEKIRNRRIDDGPIDRIGLVMVPSAR
jgi:hypothetical protein